MIDAENITAAEQLVEARRRVASLIELLGFDELHVLELVAQGLARGRSGYGELRVSSDTRDFTSEAVAELRDAMVYVGAQLVRLHPCEEPHVKRSAALTKVDASVQTEQRPRTRGDCVNGPPPCPWVACRHHVITLRARRDGAISVDGGQQLAPTSRGHEPDAFANAIVQRILELPTTCSPSGRAHRSTSRRRPLRGLRTSRRTQFVAGSVRASLWRTVTASAFVCDGLTSRSCSRRTAEVNRTAR